MRGLGGLMLCYVLIVIGEALFFAPIYLYFYRLADRIFREPARTIYNREGKIPKSEDVLQECEKQPKQKE